MPFFSQFFVNPGFWWLSALIGVPILIWLINRHRYRRRPWAAMTFLLKALKKSQRRLQLQNLLILLIRCLILLFLVLAIMRPVLQRNPFTGSDEGQNWIFVVDTSYSMDYREGSISLFDQARSTVADVLEGMLQEGDQVACMTLADEPRVLLERSAVSPASRHALTRELDDVELSHRSVRLVTSLRMLEDLAGSFSSPVGEPEPCSVVFFSDLQRKDWLGAASSAASDSASPEAKDILGGLVDRGCKILVARLSSTEEKLNVAVTDLSITPELVSTGVPVQIRVTLENFGKRDAVDLDLSLDVSSDAELDADGHLGEALTGEVVRVPAASSITRILPHRFDEPGYYSVLASVRSDGLVIDNRRFLVARVEKQVSVLLVDGDPAVEPIDRETFYLNVALAPRDDSMGTAGAGGTLGGRVSPFEPEERSADSLEDVHFDRYSAVVLANVADLPKDTLAALERYVAEGGALMVFLGSNVRPQVYDRLFRASSAGDAESGGDEASEVGSPVEREQLLPVPLLEVRGDEQSPVYLQFDDRSHPIVRYFEDHEETTDLLKSLVPFYRYLRTEIPDGDRDLRVIARFKDLDLSPAIFDNAYGRGRVLWYLSTADQGWNELPVWRDFVVFIYEAISYLVGFRQRADNLEVGELFEYFYDSREFASEVLLEAPPLPSSEVDGPRTFRRPMRELEGEKRFAVTYEDTRVPGLYRLQFNRQGAIKGGDEGEPDDLGETVESDTGTDPLAEAELLPRPRESQLFAVNVDTSESDLASMTATDFTQHFAFQPIELDFSARLRDLEAERERLRGHEYWPWCLGAVVLLLLLETALAQRFGRRAA